MASVLINSSYGAKGRRVRQFAGQAAQEEQAIGLDDDAVHLRNRLVVKTQIAIFLTTHERQIFDDVNRSRTIKRNQLGAHGEKASKDEEADSAETLTARSIHNI